VIDQVLLEVPLHVTTGLRVDLLVGEELVERVGILPLDRDLLKEREARLLLLAAELLDLQVRARLLTVEVVGGKREDLETLDLVLFLE
jgi:hypothetical protein